MTTRTDPERLLRRRRVTVSDLLAKAENEDWHGVADAAMDLREIDAALAVLKELDGKKPEGGA